MEDEGSRRRAPPAGEKKLESQLSQKTVNLIFSLVIANNKLTISREKIRLELMTSGRKT